MEFSDSFGREYGEVEYSMEIPFLDVLIREIGVRGSHLVRVIPVMTLSRGI